MTDVTVTKQQCDLGSDSMAWQREGVTGWTKDRILSHTTRLHDGGLMNAGLMKTDPVPLLPMNHYECGSRGLVGGRGRSGEGQGRSAGQ